MQVLPRRSRPCPIQVPGLPMSHSCRVQPPGTAQHIALGRRGGVASWACCPGSQGHWASGQAGCFLQSPRLSCPGEAEAGGCRPGASGARALTSGPEATSSPSAARALRTVLCRCHLCCFTWGGGDKVPPPSGLILCAMGIGKPPTPRRPVHTAPWHQPRASGAPLAGATAPPVMRFPEIRISCHH